MTQELLKQYSPKEVEDKWYAFWEEQKLFSAKANSAKKPFCIVIPPPNVTGILHMGHALNNTIQDILIRYQRMLGKEALWVPGTDHAGIATQNVVEKSIAKEGLKRQDLGREKFIERAWQWKEQYGSTIIRQLKKLGASCDWERLRFTMDEGYSKGVIEVFVRLYEKGLIYQGSYIINWCPRCQTALSDEEAPHRQLEGNLYYLRYPLTKDEGRRTKDEYVIVATTRPETMLGDTAVAVNPKDKRYKALIGKTLVLPLVNREIKIIADSSVDMKFGTGAVKVTPAHDPNDYALGKKHSLEFINVMRPDGRMNESAGEYRDMDRFQAREVILKDLKEKGLLEKVEAHQLSAGHCYRCHTIIEPYLSKQWFVKMKPLAKPAIAAVKLGKIKFHPKRWAKVYLNWMENIQDWCISRQIWWGHRLPVYYCKKCLKQAGESIVHSQQSIVKTKPTDYGLWTMDRHGIIVSRTKPEKCPECGSADIYQDEDVLDTWFSSWLWPFVTFGWPSVTKEEGRRKKDESSLVLRPSSIVASDLNYFYPTSVLVTAPEIIFFWVARMIMAGFEFMGKEPFADVYIHGTVRDIEGKKMSKSLGNVIDPLEIINEYGTDALRFSLISITTQGQDVFLSKERFEQGRNFANKIWNAARFILMNLDGMSAREDLCLFVKNNDLSLANRWILSRFYTVLKELSRNLDNYKFNEAANLLYGFFWHEFCDWYLEMVKPVLVHSPQSIVNSKERKDTQLVMYKILEKFLRALHPFMPFITEEIWQKIHVIKPSFGSAQGRQGSQVTSIMIEPWPHAQNNLIDKLAEQDMAIIFELITAFRNMRAELEIPLQNNIAAKIFSSNRQITQLLGEASPYIMDLAKLKGLEIGEKYTPAPGQFAAVAEGMHLVIPLSGILDVESYKKKIEEKIKVTEIQAEHKKNLLANNNFAKKAPKEVVEKEIEKLGELKAALTKLKAVKDAIS
ncbi:MAG: valine--tRNA ligase [Candidatus Omnitrophota bacterium]